MQYVPTVLAARILSRLILVSAVLVAMLLAFNELYLSAAGLTVGLAGYGYLVLWGDEPIEKRLF